MMFHNCRILLSAASLLLCAIGCTGEAPVIHVVTPGITALPDASKADNYISTNAREFRLTGIAHAQLPADIEDLSAPDRELRMQKAIDSRLGRVIRAIRNRVKSVIREKNGGSTSETDSWFIYVKKDAGSSILREAKEDGTVSFDFTLELVGNVYLMSGLTPGQSGRRVFDVEVSDFDGTLQETVGVEIAGTESRDAFPRYNELFEDGIFDIAIHFGGDYNEERLDIQTAEWLVEHLLDSGFSHPTVQSFEDLKIDSEWFTRTVTVEHRPIEVRVRVVHSDMVEPVEEHKLSDAMKSSMAMADVVFYSGHAGPGAGFILDYQPKHEIKAKEFASLDLPSKYQIFVLDGCQTYRTYVEDLMSNPAKTWDNMNIITTVNTTPFGAGYQVLWEFLHWFTITNDQGAHFPLSWKAILRGVNALTANFESIHYGVHGVDHNPGLNPHGGAEHLCQPCSGDDACGAGGNLCLGYGLGASCGVACTTDSACPQGFRCARLTDDPKQFYLPKQCVKRDYMCNRP